MCGIFACLSASAETLHQQHIAKLCQRSFRQRHRGPDERDYRVLPLTNDYGTRQLLLAHERLQIIDLSTGRQPIAGCAVGSWVIHNGEIYNHKALCAEMTTHALHTTCDSEVLVHAVEELKSDEEAYELCNRLDGVFSFVAVTHGTRLVVARDPIGVKPLYWGSDNAGREYFASEMKCIADLCDKELHVFPPGHFYTPSTGFRRYYEPMWLEVKNCTRTTEHAHLRDALIAATKKRLMTDVPLGVLLSGGLDSSLTAAIAARCIRRCGADIHSDKLHSFTIALDANAPDAIAARKVAAHIGSVHHEVHFTVAEGIQALSDIVYHLETYDVTTVRAGLPMYFLSRYIRRQGIKVVLSGEGADEIFGGYLYFHNAPSDDAFVAECIRRVCLLSTADCQRADKAPMAHSIEVRVPFLDRHFLDLAMQLEAKARRPHPGGVEKRIVREAFDDATESWLPRDVLWRQKEQFSDGVGYNWIDQIKAHCEAQVTDTELAEATKRFSVNPPKTKEAFFIRSLFIKHFGADERVAQTVKVWTPKWQLNDDPSGRASAQHLASTEKFDMCDMEPPTQSDDKQPMSSYMSGVVFGLKSMRE